MMRIHTIATYVLLSLVGMVVAALAAYYVVAEFVYPVERVEITVSADLAVAQFTGRVIAVDRDSTASGRPTVVVVRQETGEIKRVSLKTDFETSCLTTAIAAQTTVELGDEVAVRGVSRVDGMIEPCTDSSHFFTIKERKPVLLPPASLSDSLPATTTLEQPASQQLQSI